MEFHSICSIVKHVLSLVGLVGCLVYSSQHSIYWQLLFYYKHFCTFVQFYVVSPYNLVTVTPRSSLTGQYENVVFTCESEGGPGNTFEWYHGNQLLSGKTAPLLEIAMVTPSDAGDYNCTVTNAAGSGSDVATLTGESLLQTSHIVLK